MQITEHSFLDALLKSELLGLHDLLNLGATCKALHARLRTGQQLPANVEYKLQGARGFRGAKEVVVCAVSQTVYLGVLLSP